MVVGRSNVRLPATCQGGIKGNCHRRPQIARATSHRLISLGLLSICASERLEPEDPAGVRQADPSEGRIPGAPCTTEHHGETANTRCTACASLSSGACGKLLISPSRFARSYLLSSFTSNVMARLCWFSSCVRPGAGTASLVYCTVCPWIPVITTNLPQEQQGY